MASGAREYTRSYSELRGVDRDGGGASISQSRLALSINMYRDYEGEGGGLIESIPGFRRLHFLEGRINGIFRQVTLSGETYVVVHSGTSLFRFNVKDIDLSQTPEQIGTVADARSHVFSHMGELYLLDGEGMHRISEDGEVHTIVEDDADAYVPVTRLGGEELEQRNLLSRSFVEDIPVSEAAEYLAKTEELKYTVLDPDLCYCGVSGIEEGYSGSVFIPKYVTLGGIRYRVTDVCDYAFDGNEDIEEVTVANGVLRIGRAAFRGARRLAYVRLPSTVSSIGVTAFAHCDELATVYLGSGLSSIGSSAFELTGNLYEVHYELSEEDFNAIEGSGSLTLKDKIYNSSDRSICLSFPVSAGASAIEKVRIGEERTPYFTTTIRDGRIREVTLTLEDEAAVEGRTVRLEGKLLELGEGEGETYPEFLTTRDGGRLGGFRAITRCTVAECFDGRIFLSGNPELPNTVFYTERDRHGDNHPLYFGARDFFTDGVGSFPVISLLSVGDTLAVFKSGDDGTGSIIYHSVRETGDPVVPKVYPRSYVHSGLSAAGEAISFLDDPVFVSSSGISALAEKNISRERSIATRSHNVNADLLTAELSSVTLLEWCGYLAVCTNDGRIFLGDSRSTFTHETGNVEYEWFVLEGIGTWQGGKRVYRYASIAPEGYELHPTPGEVCNGIIFSKLIDGELVRFTEENEIRYIVYNDGEWVGGSFSPAVTFASFDGRLFFGTEQGELCVFNNDKRGVPPPRLLGAGFDAEEYERTMGRRIHDDFYAFIDRAPRYAIKTKLDDCGIPHLTKNTVRGSLTVKCRSSGSGSLHLEVGTDRSGYEEVAHFSGGRMDFSSFDFSSVTLDTKEYYTLPMREREKRWVEKQITVYSDSYCSPIGIYSITYRYRIKGNIKKI